MRYTSVGMRTPELGGRVRIDSRVLSKRKPESDLRTLSGSHQQRNPTASLDIRRPLPFTGETDLRYMAVPGHAAHQEDRVIRLTVCCC